MKLLEFARGSAFWIIDSLKGKKLNLHLKFYIIVKMGSGVKNR